MWGVDQHDYIIRIKKKGRNIPPFGAILRGITEAEAQQELWKFKKANPGRRFILEKAGVEPEEIGRM